MEIIKGLCKQNAALLFALRLCLPIMEAHTGASHLTDGFRPMRNKNDDILDRVKAAIKEGEGL
jgi:hypothetical protein